VTDVGDERSAHRGEPLPVNTIVLTMIAAAVVWLVRPPLLSPIVWFGTLAHESGHAVTAQLVGGEVVTVSINGRAGGVTYWLHPTDLATWRLVLVATAGYLSAVVAGAVLVVGAARGRTGRVVAIAAAVVVALVTIAWVPWNGPDVDAAAELFTGSSSSDGRFTWIFSICTVAFLVVLLWLPTRARQIVLLFAGVTCFLAALDALRVLIGVSETGAHSDAATVGDLVALPTWLVAIVWTGIAGAVGWWTLRLLVRDEPEDRVPG
jgi:hypothetical protein